MLKIKGLKKKKKGKKGKHKEEDDLFDPQELEQYRREHQQKQEVGVSSDTGTGEEASSSEQSEEWKKFQALTAGVDDILKKTQGDLSRIKETSYFKRKPPGPSQEPGQEGRIYDTRTKKWIRADGSAVEEQVPEEVKQKETGEENANAVEDLPPTVEEEEEEEEESENDEDIFDTSYVDVVASGEVKLAYIPDSPTEEELGPDPFDTSIVDKVIKVDPKKKNLVSLGCAVEVLTGKVEKAIPVTESLPAKRKRPKKHDLLLGSFDEADVSLNEPKTVIDEPVAKSILDEEPELVLDEIDLSINFATQLPPPSPLVERKVTTVTEKKENTFSKPVVEEFHIVIHSNQVPVTGIDEELDDEFAALAQESILKEGNKDPNVKFGDDVNEDGLDPFDTEFAANILPGKFELKLIEEEILLKEHNFPVKTVPKFLEDIPSVRLNDAVNEHNFLDEEQTPLSYKHRDLLGGSTTDLSKIGDSPIEPAAPKDSEVLIYSDPFDTSAVDVLSAPGKTELKFLEKELLDSVIQIEDSDNFNPRADCISKSSKPPVRPDQLPVGGKRFSIPKVVAFNIDTLDTESSDLLAVDEEDSAKISKPLTPYYASSDVVNIKDSCDSDKNISDPFDTSFVTHAPGKAELKLIESELSKIVDRPIKRTLSDPDFDPRQGDLQSLDTTNTNKVNSSQTQLILKSPEKLQLDILSSDSEITVKLHTPVVPKKIEEELDKFDYSDPFDTSIVNDILPGKAELKLIESELISSDSETAIKRSYTDPDFNPRDFPHKEGDPRSEEVSDILDNSEDPAISKNPLCPEPISILSGGLQADYSYHQYEDTVLSETTIDPFDTSCVDSLVPGKTELKLLESELLN